MSKPILVNYLSEARQAINKAFQQDARKAMLIGAALGSIGATVLALEGIVLEQREMNGIENASARADRFPANRGTNTFTFTSDLRCMYSTQGADIEVPKYNCPGPAH